MNAVFNITCETNGAPGIKSSYLQWSKRDNSGTFKNISLYASSILLTRSERITDQYIDVDTLTFKHFSKEDEGLYKCVRHMPRLSDTDNTETVIDIKLYTNLHSLQDTPVTKFCYEYFQLRSYISFTVLSKII